MRRLLIFAALLSLLGLSTAFAASFTVQSEDIASFTTDVSISVPTRPFPSPIYLGGSGTSDAGTLLLTTPANSNTTTRLIKHDVQDVQAQTDPATYFTWKLVDPVPATDYMLSGTVKLLLEQDEAGTERMTAGLLECESAADNSSADTEQCDLITTGVATALDGNGDQSSGFKDRTVVFAAFAPTLIEAANDLRLKIVNRSPDSTTDWTLSWGYNPARPSSLVITP